jgi:outer membrane protein assembly factor BamB
MKRVNSELVALLLLSATCFPATAQTPEPAGIRGDSPQTRKRLAEAEHKLLNGKPADAIDELHRILDELGADLISIDGKQFRPASFYVQEILAKMPPDALASYQDQVESPARKLLDSGKRTRDAAPLIVLLDRYFVSRPADEGCLLLGDLLFEQGDFRSAGRYWRRLLPGKSMDLTYPGSRQNRALLWARVILAAIFEGDTQRAREELASFQATYPNERGAFAGENGDLAAILAKKLQAPPAINRSANAGTEWPTFGGEPGHSGLVGARFPAEWRFRPAPVRIPRAANDSVPFAHAQPTPFGHPVVVGDRLFVTNGMHLFEYNLRTEQSSMPIDLSVPPHQSFGEKLPPPPCPSLTASGNRLFVRTGPVVFHASSLSAPGDGKRESAIVCYAIAPTPGKALEERWRILPPQIEGKSPAVWEGAPQAAGRRLWAAYMRLEGGRAVHGIVCYDPADIDTAPERPAWAVEVCDSQLTGAYENRTRQELVTLAGRNVVFCTNTGAVVALDAATGRRAWAFRYQRDHRSNPTRSSNPAPAVASCGRIFVAPADASHVYSLDPETGELLWESAEVKGASILGVAAGKVIVSVAEGARGLRALDCATGSYLLNGWHNSPINEAPGRGHGFVTNEIGMWPSSTGLWSFNPASGDLILNSFRTVAGSPIGSLGSTIFVDGRMIVVTATEIWIYTSELKAFGPVGRQLSAGEAAALEFNRIFVKAERALHDRQPSLSRETLLSAARSELPATYRAWAAARLFLLSRHAGTDVDFERDLASVLTPELRSEWVIAPDGIPVTLDGLIAGGKGEQPIVVEAAASVSHQFVSEKPRVSGRVGIDRTVRAPPGSAPLRFIGGCAPPKHIYLTTDSQLIAVDVGSGRETSYPATVPFTHVAEITQGFIAAGPTAVALYDGTGRSPHWQFRVPGTPLLSEGGEGFPICSDLADSAPELFSFRMCGSYLIARLGERHLVALDLLKRGVAWVLSSDGSTGYRSVSRPRAPVFQPEYAANQRFICVQLSNGQRWDVRTHTGERIQPSFLNWLAAMVEQWTARPGRDCSTRPRLGFSEAVHRMWESPPIQLDGYRIVEAEGPAHVRRLDLSKMRVDWKSGDGKRETSLTGAPPQMRVWGEVLVTAVQRNHGVEVDCLSLQSGKSQWRNGVVFLDADQIRLADADCDRDHLYIPVGDSLAAIDLATGASKWEASLPDAKGSKGWAVRAGHKCVVAYPVQALPRERIDSVAGRMAQSLRRDPEPRRLPFAGAGMYDVWTTRSLPVITFDLESGKELGKVVIPARGPAVTVCFQRDHAVIATGEQVCWLK